MAKRKANAGLPSTSKPREQAAEQVERPPAPQPVASTSASRPPVLMRPDPDDGRWHPSKFEVQDTVASIELPLAITGDPMSLRKDLDIRNLTPKQSLGLFAIERGFLTSGATTNDGCEVNSRQQAVRKLLELAADSVGK